MVRNKEYNYRVVKILWRQKSKSRDLHFHFLDKVTNGVDKTN